jgi:hypothetical protein
MQATEMHRLDFESLLEGLGTVKKPRVPSRFDLVPPTPPKHRLEVFLVAGEEGVGKIMHRLVSVKPLHQLDWISALARTCRPACLTRGLSHSHDRSRDGHLDQGDARPCSSLQTQRTIRENQGHWQLWRTILLNLLPPISNIEKDLWIYLFSPQRELARDQAAFPKPACLSCT